MERLKKKKLLDVPKFRQSFRLIRQNAATTQTLSCVVVVVVVSTLSLYYLRIENAEGYVLIAVYLYACVRVIRISQKVLNRIA